MAKKNRSLINPAHYKSASIRGLVVEPADVIEAFVSEDAHLSQALKYLLRHGTKPGTTYLGDVGKGLWWVARAILVRKGKIELPPHPLTGAVLTVVDALIPDKKKKKKK